MIDAIESGGIDRRKGDRVLKWMGMGLSWIYRVRDGAQFNLSIVF
jgi:hypothetical protein